MEIDFKHHQTAHCESGVIANLITHYGHRMSEAMAFGIGSGLFFAYLPFIKLNKLPLTTYRCATGGILKKVFKELGIQVTKKQFRDPEMSMHALDMQLEKNIPVGLQTGAWWLPYFPVAYRFHFNMHNLVVYGKKGDEYLISDPVFPEPVRCRREDLIKARYAKGVMAPKGKMYYLETVPEHLDLQRAIIRGIQTVNKSMLKTPLPLIGIRGIRFLARCMERWPQKMGNEKALLHLGQVIRMQEEIGTGGGGFRFIHAAFLQESATILNDSQLSVFSERMTVIGDLWRGFAVAAARNCKGRATQNDSYGNMADMLRECADREQRLYLELDAFCASMRREKA